MPQTQGTRAYDYEMPRALPYLLVSRTTWDLACRGCGRHAHPDVIALLERYGDDFDSDVLWHRARCKECGERMKMCGGAFVSLLQRAGDLHRLLVAGGGDFRKICEAGVAILTKPKHPAA